MRKILVAVVATSLLLSLVAASAFGSTESEASNATSPQLKGSVAPPKLGYYAGIECARWSCSYYSESREAMRYHCASLMGVSGYPRGAYPGDFHGYNIICFKLSASNQLSDFHIAGYKIVRSVYVSSDRFPETCDNGYCIDGEWFSTTSEQGRVRNPNHVYTDYKAEWFAS